MFKKHGVEILRFKTGTPQESEKRGFFSNGREKDDVITPFP